MWFTIGVTGVCFFKYEFCCSHCPESGKNKLSNHQYKVPFTLKLKHFKKIVDLCYAAKVPKIHICGTGEPFLHPHIFDFIDYTIKIYGSVSLQTDFSKQLFKNSPFIKELLLRKKNISYITTDIFPERLHNGIKIGSDFSFLINCLKTICSQSDISINANLIISKRSYKGITALINQLHKKKINFNLDIDHLFLFGFNDFTSFDNLYLSSDLEITQELISAKARAKDLGIDIRIPLPWDLSNDEAIRCNVFWQKFQTMPSKKLPKERWSGNAIPQPCPVVVLGDIQSIGNILNYQDFMQFWNNPKLQQIRGKIIEGRIPDPACSYCHIGQKKYFRKLTLAELIYTHTHLQLKKIKKIFF